MSQGGFNGVYSLLGVFAGLQRPFAVPVDVEEAVPAEVGRTILDSFSTRNLLLETFEVERTRVSE